MFIAKSPEHGTKIISGVRMVRIIALKSFSIGGANNYIEEGTVGGFVRQSLDLNGSMFWADEASIVMVAHADRVADSIILGSTVDAHSTAILSYVYKSNLKSSSLTRSKACNSRIVNSTIIETVALNSIIRESYILGSSVRDSKLKHGDLNHSRVTNGSNLKSVKLIHSNVNSTKASTQLRATVFHSSLTGCTLAGAQIYHAALEDAYLGSQSDFMTIASVGRDTNGFLTLYRKRKNGPIRLMRGCFDGTPAQFFAQSKAVHNPDMQLAYRQLIEGAISMMGAR